uniref:Lectin/glucanase superfamily protein n=1 Tax=viral metagenome TaxID=1070528 RepID=A0A6C0DUQ8_9ZZZZ
MSGIMNAAANKSSPIGRLVPMLLVLAGLIGLYYLYQYLFGPKSTNAYTLISGTQNANIDPSKPITITSDKLPIIYEGGEFTISTWIYVTNWSYRTGFNKSIISVGGPNFDTIRVYLGGNKPKLSVRLQTKDMSGAMNAVPSGATAINVNLGATKSQVPVESLDKGTQNATFGILQTDSGLLDGSPLCDLPEIDLQRWVNITVSVNGRTVDVYMDGKLARSCVLPSFFKVDAGGYSANLLAYGGFGGQIATTTMYDSALNPEVVYKNYMAGPQPITNIGQWFSSFFAPGVSISVTTK